MFSNKGPWNEYPGDEFGESAKLQLLEEQKSIGDSEFADPGGYPVPIPPPNPGMIIPGSSIHPGAPMAPVIQPTQAQVDVQVSLAPGVQNAQTAPPLIIQPTGVGVEPSAELIQNPALTQPNMENQPAGKISNFILLLNNSTI